MRKTAKHLPDTNVVLRYLLRDIPEQYELAERFFETVRLAEETAVILESVLVECVYILTKFYKIPKAETAAILTGLLHYKGIVNQDKVSLIEALETFARLKLDIVDCILISKAKAGNLKIFSFDKALKKQEVKLE